MCCLCGGSYSASGATACTVCPNGTTNSGTGNTSCTSSCSNASNVSSWNNATWNSNNTVSNTCNIATCSSGDLENNVCVSSATWEYIDSYSANTCASMCYESCDISGTSVWSCVASTSDAPSAPSLEDGKNCWCQY